MSVDETPLTTSPHERRDSLEKHLQTRPDMQDLKDRHILLDTNVAPYVVFLTTCETNGSDTDFYSVPGPSNLPIRILPAVALRIA